LISHIAIKVLVKTIISAEEARFELAVPCDTPVFKTGALNHYATPPGTHKHYRKSFNYSTVYEDAGGTVGGAGTTGVTGAPGVTGAGATGAEVTRPALSLRRKKM
jgi:hypothetical protein